MLKMLQKGMLFGFLASSMVVLSACSSKVGPAEAYKGETPRQIFENGEADMEKGDFSEAIKRFEALEVQYPLNHESEIAELHLMYSYYRKEEYTQAEEAAARFIRQHPMNQHTDYAYFIQALSEFYENQGNMDRVVGIDLAKRDSTSLKKSFGEFSTLVERFPNSRYAPAAYHYMIYLRNLLARHQLQVAQFYYDRGAYVASANRASQVVKYYQGAPEVKKALVLLAKDYKIMHLTRQEKEIQQIIQNNYPNG